MITYVYCAVETVDGDERDRIVKIVDAGAGRVESERDFGDELEFEFEFPTATAARKAQTAIGRLNLGAETALVQG